MGPEARGQASLARWYDRLGAAVFGLAYRVTGDAEVAARLTAEVFAEVFADVTDDIDESTLETALMAAVHRRAVEWVRTFRPPPTPPVRDTLAGLPATEREVIAAAYFDGLTCADIGARLGIDRREVANLIQRGMRRLTTLHALA